MEPRDARHPAEICLHTLFEAHAERRPAADALRCADRTATFGAVNARANQAARYLRHLGVGPETLAALVFEPSVDAVVATLAVLKAGGGCIVLDPTAPFDRIGEIVDTARPLLGLTRSAAHVRLPRMRLPVVYLDEVSARLDTEADTNLETPCLPDSIAFVTYGASQGTRPAGVVVTHRALAHDVRALAGHELADGACAVSGPGAIERLLVPLVRGIPVTIVPAHDAGEAAESMAGVRPRAALPDVYVVAEAGGRVLVSGCPLADASSRTHLLDANLAPAPDGAEAEIYVGGDGLARGYLGRPGLTAERFVADPFGHGTRLYRTGDLGKRQADGTIQVLGPVEEIVRIGGQPVPLDEIEAALQQHAKVREAAVWVQKAAAGAGGPGEPALVGYVVAEGIAPSVSELRQHLAARVAEHLVPETFVTLNRLPRTIQGRIDRRALPQPQPVLPAAQQEYAAPRNAIEVALTEIWAELLLLDRIGIHDDFLDIGGDSLIATQIVARIWERFGTEIPLEALFEQGTIASLAEQFFTDAPRPASAPRQAEEV